MKRHVREVFYGLSKFCKTPNSNTIIYGHHMGDNTMFDVLEKYLKQSYFDQHQNIQYDTKYGKYQLQVLVHIALLRKITIYKQILKHHLNFNIL